MGLAHGRKRHASVMAMARGAVSARIASARELAPGRKRNESVKAMPRDAMSAPGGLAPGRARPTSPE